MANPPELPAAHCSQRLCSALALVIVYKGDLFLDFCGHHFNMYRPVLLLDGFEVIQDERLQGQRFETSFDDSTKGITGGVPKGSPSPNKKPRPA